MFFKILDRAPLARGGVDGREFAIAHLAQFAAQSLHGDGEAELLKHPLSQIDQPPAHTPGRGAGATTSRARRDLMKARCAPSGKIGDVTLQIVRDWW